MTDIQENQKDNIVDESDGSEWDKLIADLERRRDEINRIMG